MADKLQPRELKPHYHISPIDGRYHEKTKLLAPYVSEAGLIRFRLKVEAGWLLHLSKVPQLKEYVVLRDAERHDLEQLWNLAAETDAIDEIKKIEERTNHDVKAVEYYLRNRLLQLAAHPKTLCFIHFGCTSEDINNLAYSLMLNETRQRFIIPALDKLLEKLAVMAEDFAGASMLARTHGQPATPTTLGKELAVFGSRLLRQRARFVSHALLAKLNGAVGNYNAYRVSFPDIDWPQVSKHFIEKTLGLQNNPLTTQIESHDSLVEYCEMISHINVILIGLCRDLWGYISWGYLQQSVNRAEVGSSTMPHKVNPIDFENAEGNLGVANSIGQHFADKLPISRFQRDLSDSTVLRNLGSFLSYSVIGYDAISRGLEKVQPNMVAMIEDLNQCWEILAEPLQVLLRKHGVQDAYEILKSATRGPPVTRQKLLNLAVQAKALDESDLDLIRKLIPADYIGYAKELAIDFANRWKIT